MTARGMDIGERTALFVFGCAALAASIETGSSVTVDMIVEHGRSPWSLWKQAAIFVARELEVSTDVIAVTAGLSRSAVAGHAFVVGRQVVARVEFPVCARVRAVRSALLPPIEQIGKT